MPKQAIYYEDDYCLIEVLPIENSEFCLSQIDAIQQAYKRNVTVEGYFTDVFIRSAAPISLASLNIKKEEISQALSSIMVEYEEVVEGSGPQLILEKNTTAYSNEVSDLIFVTYDYHHVVKVIWFKTVTSLDICKLPYKEKLLIVDWTCGFCCPLSNTEEIQKYIEFING